MNIKRISIIAAPLLAIIYGYQYYLVQNTASAVRHLLENDSLATTIGIKTQHITTNTLFRSITTEVTIGEQTFFAQVSPFFLGNGFAIKFPKTTVTDDRIKHGGITYKHYTPLFSINKLTSADEVLKNTKGTSLSIPNGIEISIPDFSTLSIGAFKLSTKPFIHKHGNETTIYPYPKALHISKLSIPDVIDIDTIGVDITTSKNDIHTALTIGNGVLNLSSQSPEIIAQFENDIDFSLLNAFSPINTYYEANINNYNHLFYLTDTNSQAQSANIKLNSNISTGIISAESSADVSLSPNNDSETQVQGNISYQETTHDIQALKDIALHQWFRKDLTTLINIQALFNYANSSLSNIEITSNTTATNEEDQVTQDKLVIHLDGNEIPNPLTLLISINDKFVDESTDISDHKLILTYTIDNDSNQFPMVKELINALPSKSLIDKASFPLTIKIYSNENLKT